MNKKKWIGATMSVSLVASATQNFAFCDDLVDILNTDKVNRLVKSKNHEIFTMAEYARHCLRKARDEAVAYGIAERMQNIFGRYPNGYAKIELEDILKEFSKENRGELSYHFIIDKLLNITVDEMTDYESDYSEEMNVTERTIKIPFKDKQKLLEKLLDFEKTENEVLAIYKDYDQKMKEIENEVKRIINKNVITCEDLKAIDTQIKLAEGVVKAFYITPAGYIRYLASRGVFLNKKSFPGMDDEHYYNEVLVWFYSHNLPSTALNLTYKAVTKAMETFCFPLMLVNFFVNPIVKEGTKKVDDLVLYKALNQDPHMSSMFKHSSLVRDSEFQRYIGFDFEKYITDRVEKAVTIGCNAIRENV